MGAIHFAPPKFRSGDAGVKPRQLYLELGLHGSDRRAQVEAMGVRCVARASIGCITFSRL